MRGEEEDREGNRRVGVVEGCWSLLCLCARHEVAVKHEVNKTINVSFSLSLYSFISPYLYISLSKQWHQ